MKIWMAIPWVLSAWTAAFAQERLTPYRESLAKAGHLRDVSVDGHRYAVVDRGKGRAIVLLHGLGGSLYDWRHLLAPLEDCGRVVAPDFLGAGESDKPAGEDYSVAAQARRVKGLLDALRLEKATLVGNSFGGGVALRFAQDWPERVDRLVLIDSICYPEAMPCYVGASRIPWAECIAETLPVGPLVRWVLRGTYRIGDKLTEEEIGNYVAEVRSEGRRAAIVRTVRAVVPPDTREFEARLKAIRAPSLLLWGVHDRTVPVALGRKLARDLPDARWVELDAGHVPHQECPDQVLRHVREFLK